LGRNTSGRQRATRAAAQSVGLEALADRNGSGDRRAALNEKGRRTLALARARTELIAEQLHAAGLKAEAAWDSPAFQQKNREKAQGQTAWCVVRLQPVFETGGVRAGPAVKS
jgi:hypothetical protein